MQKEVFYKVAVNTPFNNSILTYKGEEDELRMPGELVSVPLGKRSCVGCILEAQTSLSDEMDPKKIKFITEKTQYGFQLGAIDLTFLKWTAQYYHYPMGQLIGDVLPKPLKRPRALKYEEGEALPLEFELNPDQVQVVERVSSSLNKFDRFLVHGVTGSGKTAIYLKLAEEVIKSGRSVLFLLPEINLTPQFIKTFAKHVSAKVFVYNSSVSNSDKYGLWKRLSEDEGPCLIIGVRSSIFLPVKKLGLLIVDEEHDSSFKQEDRCPYNARDLAIKKAQLHKCPVLLGSATPSLESFELFRKIDRYMSLKSRAISKSLPEIELIDMRNTGKDAGESSNYDIWPFSEMALQELEKVLEKGEQALVFLNRLGYADFLQCKMCGHQFSCPNCSANLKFFKNRLEISCQICGYKDRPPEMCPECQSLSIVQKGYGTERLTEVLRERFQDKRIERFDRDEITTFNELNERLEQFHQGEIDIFVGTQMLSKGHNFKKVNLVLVMGIDAQLNFPDYRATERAYQLLTQISGRPGRFGEHGRVLVHTLNTEHPLFERIKAHDFDGFYPEELEMRKLCECPPFKRLAMLYLTAKSRELAGSEAQKMAQMCEDLIAQHFLGVDLLGPRPSLVEKRVNKFTWTLMLRAEKVNELHNLIKTLRRHMKLPSGVSFKLDIDPYHLY
jgi:primosomal protein N' (replication factor Y)